MKAASGDQTIIVNACAIRVRPRQDDHAELRVPLSDGRFVGQIVIDQKSGK
jgi:hypothetical protein